MLFALSMLLRNRSASHLSNTVTRFLLVIAASGLGEQTIAAQALPTAAQALPTAAPALRAQPEVLTGRITGTQGVPIAGAVVIVTMAPDRVMFTDTTKASGDFRIAVTNGTGDYLLYVSAVGYIAQRKRLTRAGSDSVFTFNAQLISTIAQLATVKTVARKPELNRGLLSGAEPGAAERVPDAVNGMISPEQAGDLNTLAALQPGMLQTGTGYSVLGLGAGQNSATLNGMGFAGTSLPRDLPTTTRISTSTYDPARGWFSGSNISVDLPGAGLFASSRGHITVDAPAFQAADPISASAGQRFSNLRASYGAWGPLTYANKHFYNIAVQADRRTSASPSVVNADARLLELVGVSPDVSTNLVSALNAARIPVSTQSLPGDRVVENASVLFRVEKNERDMNTFKLEKTVYGLTAFGSGSRERSTGINSLSTPGRLGESKQITAGVQGLFSRYFLKNYLSETRSSLSINNRQDLSLLDIPEGRAFVESSSSTDTDGFVTLLFGGNGAGDRVNNQWTWETINKTKFFASGHDKHQVRVTTDVRYDAYRNETRNQFGTFTYASLADVAANNPSGYSRALVTPTRTGGEWNAFAAIGDYWRATPQLSILYGARLEGNAFVSQPAFNPDVLSAVGARTDYAPSSVHVSPRLGFNWLRQPSVNMSLGPSPIGQYWYITPRYLRGGIGEFRNMTSPTLLSDAMVSTGLAGASTRLSCIGNATPIPDWSSYAAASTTIPTQCAGFSTSSFSDVAPTVRLIAPGYKPPTSWRANLAFGTQNFGTEWSVEGVYSYNLNQPGTTDRNFSENNSFTLSDDNRPVFVPINAIAPATGLVSPVSARISSQFGRIVSQNSDLQSISRQLTFTARPTPNYRRKWFVNGAYTLADTRAQTSGFDGSTFLSPVERGWARSDFDVRHQFQSQFGYTYKAVTFAGFGRLQSGLPYTPMIAGDVNGDGLSNDRAFVATTSSDAALATAMKELMNNGSKTVAKCLQSQSGRVAVRNACEGPWTSTFNAALSINSAALRNRRISNISVNFANPLAGIDQLVHGGSNLRGWGLVTAPDAVLYSVRSFDPAARRYQYEVNPRFGGAQSNSLLSRQPFRMTLDIAMDLGKATARQQLNQWLKPGRAGHSGSKLSQTDLKKRYERNVPDPFAITLQSNDSLLLNRTQVEALQAAQIPYRVKMDSVWNELAKEMADLGDNFDDAAALKRQEKAMDDGWEITRLSVHASVAEILNRLQLSLSPSWVQSLYRADRPTNYRMYSFGAVR